jgi:anti-sigma factor RsiW
MCEFSEKLIAWLDHELPDDEAGRLERHLTGCSNCRVCLAAYGEVSSRFAAYCDAMVAGPAKRRQRSVARAGAAVAAAIALVLLLPSTTTNRIPPLPPPPVAKAPAIAWQTTPVRVQTVRRRPARQTLPAQDASWQPGETDIHIAIPAEAIFPPGALPDGFQFIADVTIASDGSPQGLRLRPY